MSVYPYVGTLPEAPFETGPGYTFLLTRGSDTMYRSIWIAVQPLTLVNLTVGGIISRDKAKGADRFTRLVLTNETMSRSDLLSDK